MTDSPPETVFWTHGTSLVTETHEHVSSDGRFGWGADVSIAPGQFAWFHLPIPISAPQKHLNVMIHEVYIEFSVEGGLLRAVDVYDGAAKIQDFGGLTVQGNFTGGIQGQNTFKLSKPHQMRSGLGVSLNFSASIGFDSKIPPSRIIVSAGGALVGFNEIFFPPKIGQQVDKVFTG
jgi:hypothetical protein